MKTSTSGLAAISFYEGERLTAYQDSVGVWTIGIGHTAAAGPPTPVRGMTITHADALAYLALDLPQYEVAVEKRLPNVPQHVYDGAVSFCFNVGPGNFTKASWPALYASGNMIAAEASLKQWDRAGGQVLPGLARRRAEEADMIFRDKYPNGIASPSPVPVTPPKPDPTSEGQGKADLLSWIEGLLHELFPSWFA